MAAGSNRRIDALNGTHQTVDKTKYRPNVLFDLLRRSPTFRDCDDRLLTEMLACGTNSEVPAGATILNQDDHSLGMYWIESGTVRVSRLNHKGREYILTLLHDKSTFNDVAVIDQGCNPASVVAQTDCRLWLFPTAAVQRIVTRHPEFTMALARNIATQTRYLVQELDGLSMYSVKVRLARYLLTQAGSDYQLAMALTQEDLANHLGTVREVVSRSLRAFKREGIIHIESNIITILDKNRLITAAEI